MSIAASTAPVPSSAIESLLGGKAALKKTPRSMLDWIDVVRNGLPASVIDSLSKAIELSQAELGRAVGIPERTLARRKREGVLSSDESTRILRLARVVSRASEVFEGREAAMAWLKTSNASLGGAAPLSLLDTDIGVETVLDTLGRIEHGVFA